MTLNRGGQIGEHIELLHLAGAHHREQPGHGQLARRAPRAEHDLPPLHGGAQRPFGAVVGRFDAVVVHEDKEILVLGEERGGEVPHVIIRPVEGTLGEPEELPLEREHLGDQLRPGEGPAPASRHALKAMPEPEQAARRVSSIRADVRRRVLGGPRGLCGDPEWLVQR